MSAFEKLEKLAEAAAHDISGDFPEMDTGYNLYVEELRDEQGIRRTYSLIDMGDAYQQSFTWDGKDWHPDSIDPYLLEERILKARRY
jgi:hypothetical protein